MFAFLPFTIFSLWIILLPLFGAIWGIMAVGDKIRGAKIEDKDHTNPKVRALGTPPLVALFAVTAFTPIAAGPLFWFGCFLNLVGGVIYVLAVAAFVKAGSGVTGVGIYRLSRNPMYVAAFLSFLGFALMAWSAAPLMGLLSLTVTIWAAATFHWMVLTEERFLEKKYGDTYIAYKKSAPRYLPFI